MSASSQAITKEGLPAAKSRLGQGKAAAEFKRRAGKFMVDEFGEASKLVATPPAAAAFMASVAAGASMMASGGGGADGDTSKSGGAVDVNALLRAVTTTTPRAIGWREQRPYVMAHRVEHLTEVSSSASASAAAAGAGLAGAGVVRHVLAVSGYLRGAPLNVEQLVHLPGLGARRVLPPSLFFLSALAAGKVTRLEPIVEKKEVEAPETASAEDDEDEVWPRRCTAK